MSHVCAEWCVRLRTVEGVSQISCVNEFVLCVRVMSHMCADKECAAARTVQGFHMSEDRKSVV